MTIRFAAAVAAVGLASLACASGPPPRTPPEPAGAPLAVDPGSPARPTGGLVALKQRDGVLKVAADPDAPPFLSNGANGWEGFEAVVATTLAEGAGLKVEIVPGSFSELPGLVTSGEADLAIGQLSPSASYTGLAFSVSYLQYSLCLVVPKDSAVRDLSELKGERIGMYDDPVARQLTNVLVGASFEAVTFDDYGYFEKLVRGQLDAMVYDCPLARYELKTYGDALRVASDALNIATYNVAVRQDDSALLADVNRALRKLGEDGVLAKAEETWLGAATSGDYEGATGRVVTVRKGDTLSLIAQRELGDLGKWEALYAANEDVVGPDPDVVYAGMKLRIPR